MARTLLSIILAILAISAPAGAAEVTNVRFGEHQGRTRVVIETTAPLPYYEIFTLAEGGMRLVIDMPYTEWGPALGGSGSLGGDGYVRAARYSHNSGDTSRLVLDLNQAVSVAEDFYLEPKTAGQAHRLVLDLEPQSYSQFAGKAGPVSQQRPATPRSQGQVSQTASGTRPAPPAVITRGAEGDRVVVVDAGHGGHDPGAIGATGEYEKNVVLNGSLALKEALEALGGYHVILTRSTDVYLDHDRRVQIAREQGADLFISMHADSIGKPEVRGASVYTLSKRGAERARDKVLKNNWVMDETLAGRDPDVSGILVDLAQRDTKNQSAIFAGLLTDYLPQAGPILRNTHREANLYVLLAPDVPAVLLEMGFMSNRVDEANLTDPAYIDKLAGVVAQSIDAYFKQRERVYAAR